MANLTPLSAAGVLAVAVMAMGTATAPDLVLAMHDAQSDADVHCTVPAATT